MKNCFKLKSSGVALPEIMAAMAIISISMLGLGSSFKFLKDAFRKTEVTSISIQVESELIHAFNNTINYPDESTDPLRATLRNGTATQLTIATSFSSFTVPVGGTTGKMYLQSDGKTSCSDFSVSNCWISYEVALRHVGSVYQFAYEIIFNPDVTSMNRIGNIAEFDIPIDPANYRVAEVQSKCDTGTGTTPGAHVFMRGMNRDTGEAICAENPKNKCPAGTYPKGLKVVTAGGLTGSASTFGAASSVELDCTGPSIKASCDPNYSLWQFNPRATDPTLGGAIGQCIFTGADTWSVATTGGGTPGSGPTRIPATGFAAGISVPQSCPTNYYAGAGNLNCNVGSDGDVAKNRNGTCFNRYRGADNDTRYRFCNVACTYGPGCTTCSTTNWGYNTPVGCGVACTGPAGCGVACVTPGVPAGCGVACTTPSGCGVTCTGSVPTTYSGCTQNIRHSSCGTETWCNSGAAWSCGSDILDTSACFCWSTVSLPPTIPGVTSTLTGTSGILCNLNGGIQHTSRSCDSAGYAGIPPGKTAADKISALWSGGVYVTGTCQLDAAIRAAPVKGANAN